MKGKEKNFKLEIPIEASGIEGFKPEQGIRVAAKSRDGSINEQTVKLDARGKGKATFTFLDAPGALQVVIGPETASAAELFGMQTIGFNLPARRWEESMELFLPTVPISAYYWYWWLRWCRTFTIRGRVVCPNGNPVPGAKVCASDVDMWWWWCSKQKVGCATTDVNGVFEMKFRWCCGWLPWWWWAHRIWHLDLSLAERIMPVLQSELKLRKFPVPTPQPDLAIFEELLGDQVKPQRQLQAASVISTKSAIVRAGSEFIHQTKSMINPAALEKLSVRLKERIPVVPGLDRLHIWPWWPWHPWWDCTPDIIFQVTQNCRGKEEIIVNESCWDTRWDIPTSLNVTLVANDKACCIDPTPQPEGNCINITHVCDYPVSTIGGNLSAVATPAGFQNPGSISIYGDRPFAGVVYIRGDFGTLAGADYYELEWFDTGTMTWKSMPAGTVAGFSRSYFGPQLPAGPVNTWHVPFSITLIDGRNVIESRQHFEANNGAGTWEVLAPGSRWWMDNKDLLLIWLTENNFPDGTYQLRVKSWQLAGNNLVNPQILSQCGTEQEQDNNLLLTIDNRIEGPGSGHPTAIDHPCGGGTVHRCTTEPDTDIIDVKIIHSDSTETTVKSCGNVPINDTDVLQIDFMAHDPDGHLGYYTLIATYGENLFVDLLSLPGVTLTPLGGATVPPAVQVGPTYTDARSAAAPPHGGAVAPIWHGGAIRLRVKAKGESGAFRKTCCYQLELWAHKRTIVSCDHSLWGHTNLSEYSFMIVV